MTRINGFCLALLLMVSAASAQDPAAMPAEDHDGLRALAATMEEALNKRDLDTLLANVDDNVAFTAMNAETGYGKQHIRDYFDRMLNGPNKIVQDIKVDFVPDKLSVFYGPDVAVSAGNAASHYELTNGLKFDIDARWTATLVRKDGRWLVGAFHYSANVFRNPIMEKQRRFLVMAGGGVAILLGVIGFIVGRRRVVRPA
ncbi:MAG TPA: SgcJ/EcaC family oxidoreductase [Steroidobacteraceae bacterium]|jgi:uncharacterized protein (TIGR02246 family)|nr:SgcJ/EcaC family oxidoreductase [Steroidobacteraceae bacterium]